MSFELTAAPYIMRLDLDCDAICRGTIIRMPDGVEASFNDTDGLLVLLEGMGGRLWWQNNRAQIEERFMAFRSN